MVRLSILIPAVGDQQMLDDTLVSVLENRPAGCEVLLVHSPAYCDPYDLSDEVRFVPTVEARGTVGMLNDGARSARADVLHWIQPGCRAVPDWTHPALDCFAHGPIALAAPTICDIDQPDRILAAGVCYDRCGRRRVWGRGARAAIPSSDRWPLLAGPSLVAGFARRSLMTGRPLFSEHLAVWADVELLLAVRESQATSVWVPDSRLLASHPAIAQWLGDGGKTKDAMSESAEECFWRYRAAGSLPAHLRHLCGQMVAAIVHRRATREVASRWVGYRAAGRHSSGVAAQPAESPTGTSCLRMDPAHALPAASRMERASSRTATG